MKKTNVCDFSDLLFCAKKLGYDWNEAHDMLDYYYPYHGVRTVYIEELDEEENEDAKKILKAFFKQEKVDEFQINPKST